MAFEKNDTAGILYLIKPHYSFNNNSSVNFSLCSIHKDKLNTDSSVSSNHKDLLNNSSIDDDSFSLNSANTMMPI